MPAHGLHQGCCERRHFALPGAWRGQALQGGELHQVSYRRHGFLYRARWWQAMPARGLSQECCRWRYTPLQGAWRGQAMQGGGLHQVRYRRHGVLYGARRWQAMPAPGLHQGCSKQWFTPLRGAWRGQALQGGELHQVSSRRHGLLRGARRGQTVPARGLLHGCKSRRATLQRAWRGQALQGGELHQVSSR